MVTFDPVIKRVRLHPLNRLVLSFSGLLFLVASAMAVEIDIPYTEFMLDNGLRVIVHEDHKAPIVAVNIWYHVGSKNENLARPDSRTCSST